MPILSRTPQEPDREAQAAREAEGERRILGAIVSLLGEGRTLADVSVGEIAGRAQMSRSAFYEYFRDKRAMVLRLAEVVTERIVSEAQSWETSELRLPEEVGDIVRSMAQLFADDAPVMRAVTESAYYDEVMSTWWHEHLNLIIGAVQRCLELEQARGRLTDVRPDITACAIVWMVQQTCYQELVVSHRFTTDELVEVLTVLIERALQFAPHTSGGGADARGRSEASA